MIANDPLIVIHAWAAGPDVCRMQIIANIGVARSGQHAWIGTTGFSAVPDGLVDLAGWLIGHQVAREPLINCAPGAARIRRRTDQELSLVGLSQGPDRASLPQEGDRPHSSQATARRRPSALHR